MWHLTDKESKVTATTKAPHNTFTLGRHNWTIMGDKGCSEEGKEYTTELKMSGCPKGNFTCYDGHCVSMEQRCNQLPDCDDKSDEENCYIVVFGKSYNLNVPPVVSADEKVVVNISLNIHRLVDIKEEDYAIEIQFSIILKWKENRVKYHNLKWKTALNSLVEYDIRKLWLPKVSPPTSLCLFIVLCHINMPYKLHF